MFEFDENRPDYYSESEENTVPEAGNTINFSTESDASPSDSGENEPSPRRHRLRKVLFWIIAVAVVALAVTIWLRYYNPYVEDSRMDAYIVKVERRGMLFKTNEADIISRQAVTDTTHLYTRESSVTIADDRLAEQLRQAQGTGRPVRLITSRYYGMLPWRGASTTVVTGVE